MPVCAITGHRPTRFKWKYQENNNGCKRLKKRLRDQLTRLYEQGVRQFYLGGALGVDLWAGEILLKLKECPEYSDIEIIEVLPFQGHDIGWDDHSRSRLNCLLQHSTKTIVTGPADHPAVAYKKRNYYMVDHADYLLAVYDDDRKIRSGTGMTVNYARKKGLSITLIHPDSGVVTVCKNTE